MQQQDRVWHLLSVYLTGEASVTERKELEEMMADDADLKNLIEVATAIWEEKKAGNIDEVEAAWNKHKEKVRK